MQVLGIIPARGGSKGLTGKNLQSLGGRPLLAYTADAARASRRLSRIVLSTDDEAIASAGSQLGLDVPFVRPADLALDETPMLPVLQHAVRSLAPAFVPDAVVVLQPTSPFRRAEHIDEAIQLLETSGADSVVSVVEVPHRFNPMSMMTLDAGRLKPLVAGELILRRQDKPRVYARNGPAVLAVRTRVLDRGSLYGDDCRPLMMGADESIDIDTAADLAYAEHLLPRLR
jgi:CMP-N,N'-diacetyllegionaminic acid synthase